MKDMTSKTIDLLKSVSDDIRNDTCEEVRNSKMMNMTADFMDELSGRLEAEVKNN